MKHKSKEIIYPIGNEGNQIEIDLLSNNSYRMICRDHFSENFVDYYTSAEELRGLAEFINRYLDNQYVEN